MAYARDRESRRIDRAEHVEIHEAVVQRRHQRVGHGVSEPHQVAVVGRGIDHDEVVAVLDRSDRFGKAGELGDLVLLDLRALAAGHMIVRRQLELDFPTGRPAAPVFDVMGEGLLPAVEIDGGDALTGLEQGDRNVHRRGRFSRAALLVAEHDDVRGLRYYGRLEQHNASPRRRIIV